MDYNYKLIQMCERRLYPDQPEYLNSISALYMCFISAYYLRRQSLTNVENELLRKQTLKKFDQNELLRKQSFKSFIQSKRSLIPHFLKNEFSRRTLSSNSISIIYWCIFTNGIGSFLYHWYAWYIFKLLDEFSMIIPVWIGICKIMHNLNYSMYYTGFFTILNMVFLVLNVFLWFQDYFPMVFASQVILFIPLYSQSLKYKKDKDLIGLKGILICSGSGLVWGIIEANCNKYLIFGHSIWHIGMSTGLCYLIEYFK
jgi:hypothetical protein